MSNVQIFGANDDGTTDETEAIRHAVRDGDGMLHFPPGTYRVSQTVKSRWQSPGRLVSPALAGQRGF